MNTSYLRSYLHFAGIILFFSSDLSAATYYVSPNGRDSNSGSEISPWASLQKAANVMIGGDTTIMEDGSYESGELYFNTSGTQQSPITLRARNSHLAILATTGCNMGISVNASYVILEGFRITRSPNTSCSPITSGAAIRLWAKTPPRASGPSSTGWVGSVVRGLRIDDNRSFTIATKSNQDNSLIENNILHMGVDILNNSDTIIRNNIIYSGHGDGSEQGAGGGCKGGSHRIKYYGNIVYIDYPNDYGLIIGGVTNDSSLYDTSEGYECYDCEIFQNVIKRRDGVALSSSAYHLGMISAKNGKIYNNTVVGGPLFMDDRSSGGSCAYNKCPASYNPVWKNNIVDCQSGYAVQTGHNWNFSGSLIMDYNNFYACSSGVPSQGHSFSQNPLFVNRASDWHLQAGSFMINVGTDMGLLVEGLPDLGAYEFRAHNTTIARPVKVTGLRIF